MVPFFRKIRKSLLGKSSLGRYMLYAIGEILLVVIGILLALQIDNWNEDRQMREVEMKTLRDLKVEFTENLIDARRVYEGNMGVFEATTRLQENAKAGVFAIEETDSLMFYMFDWFDYTPKPGASNNLINAGNLNLIQNEELRYLLTLWSGVNAELDDDEQLSISYSQNTIVPFLAAHYPISNLEKYDFTLTHYDKQYRTECLGKPACTTGLRALCTAKRPGFYESCFHKKNACCAQCYGMPARRGIL